MTVGHRPGSQGGPPGTDHAAVAERLANELAERWRRGERPRAEEYLDRHPALWLRPDAAAEVILEEVCARQEAGDGGGASVVLNRFPQWRSRLELLFRACRLLEGDASPAFPAVGDQVAGFALLTELGRGGRGRVFLASQPGLADRPVVLKVTPTDGAEHLTLARLQHTNIVPLYSAEEDPDRDLRVLCMPYFGGATLARVLEVLRDRPPAERTGRDLLHVIDRETVARPGAPPTHGPARRVLERTSYVRAVCWLGAQLADALHHAHERDLVHLDVKPSNVLLATDGQPMLLDFHLARPPLKAGDPPPAWLGGTDGYMAPEQAAALAAVRAGKSSSGGVDGRADVFSLALVLYELLAGVRPPAGAEPERLDRLNPRVSVGLADVLHRCLRLDPVDRYPDVGALAADLRRHLADEPLRGVPNRSRAERWAKWRRRHPHRLVQLALGTAILCTLAAGLIAAGVYFAERARAARLLLARATTERAAGRYADALRTLGEARAVARRTPFPRTLAEQIDRDRDETEARWGREQRAAAWADEARALHAFVNRVRFVYTAGDRPPPGSAAVREACANWWRRGRELDAAPGEGSPTDRERLHTDLLDLAVIRADLCGSSGEAGAAAEATRILREAADRFGLSPVVAHELRRHGGPAPAPGGGPAPVTAWDHYALGRSYLRDGDLPRAAAVLARAVALDPPGLWPNFYHGVCAFRLGRFEDAVGAFSACVAVAPNSAECYYNRGLAFARLKRLDRAADDFGTALRLDPELGIAAVNRGVLHFQGHRYAEAEADFRYALGRGADPELVRHNLALVRQAAAVGIGAIPEKPRPPASDFFVPHP